MKDCDALLLAVAIIICLLVLIIDVWRWFAYLRSDSRTFDDCVSDIRAMNTYNSYFIGAIIVFFGLVADRGVYIVPTTALIMFLAAFVLAACAIFFHPIQKPQGGTATSGIRIRWLCALIPTQWTVILGTAALVNLMVSLLSKKL